MEFRCHHQQVPDLIHGATIPVFGAHDDYPLIQDRTGVLLKIQDHAFLLTAVHELDQWFDMATKTLTAEETIFTSSGQIVYHVAADRKDETIRLTFGWCEFLNPPLDVAILELDNESVGRLEGTTFLTVENLLFLGNPKPGRGDFILYGHPFFLKDPGCPGVPVAKAPVGWFDTTLANPAVRQQHDKDNHLILHLPHLPPEASDFDEGIKGMSGCGIWLVRYDRDGFLLPHTALVGIFHCFNQAGKWVVGTTLKCALNAIAAHYPALAGEVAKVKTL
jgi:hypothetical protein